MRFDTPVYFQRVTSVYDPDSGDYTDTVTEEKRYASVTDTGREALNLLYGQIRQGVKTVRLQRAYTQHFDRIRIGEKTYRVDQVRGLRMKYTLIVSEEQSHGDTEN